MRGALTECFKFISYPTVSGLDEAEILCWHRSQYSGSQSLVFKTGNSQSVNFTSVVSELLPLLCMRYLHLSLEVLEYSLSISNTGLFRDFVPGESIIGFQRTPFFAFELLPKLPIGLFLLIGISLGKLLNFPIKALLQLGLSSGSVRLEIDELSGLTLSKSPPGKE
jgi:hypothetical protein